MHLEVESFETFALANSRDKRIKPARSKTPFGAAWAKVRVKERHDRKPFGAIVEKGELFPFRLRGILNGSGQIIYSNMIIDQPSNTAQPSSVDSSSSTVGKPSMLFKQFDTAYTTEEHRKREWVTTTLQQATTKPKSQTFLSEV
ncbi:hypothetical protein CDL15_Pgr014607 [Punica granatum]|uniref:Uncharacterized protein n=1 Tax=Punica granatum TaxID=22663 RepID=A0A218XYK0_PUNGR|nr:hypothetical protein CDL15_Pgr014607 [Punica granatum]